MRSRLSAARCAVVLCLAVAALGLAAGPVRAAAFTDAAGRHVVLPDRIRRILPADRNAEVLVYVLAPQRLAGLERGATTAHRRHLPVLGWRPRTSPQHMAAMARRLGADVILDAGAVTPQAAAFADRVQQLAGVPYVLVDNSFARTPAVLRTLGALLGVTARADDLGQFAEHAIAGLRGRLLIRPADTRPHVYLALGESGLVTALPGSPEGEAIDEAGAINVAGALGRGGEATVTRAQLVAWNPQIIIVEHRRFYNQLRRGRAWRRLSAVRHHRVYLEPGRPFGWIDDPDGVNRLIGLHWLSVLFYPDATQEDLRTTTCDFYDKFYRVRLTNGAVEQLMRQAGIPPAPVPQVAELPLATSPGAPQLPVASVPGSGPGQPCTVQTGPSPKPLPGITGTGIMPGAPANLLPPNTPGLRRPARRGLPAPMPPR